MTISEIVGLGATITGLFTGMGIFIFKITKDTRREGNEGRQRIYARVDEVKEKIKEDMKNYVQEKVCQVQHEALQRDIAEIKQGQLRIDEKLDKLLLKVGNE